MNHRLAPMLAPGSMVIVGASGREGSFGARLAEASLSVGFQGQLSFVNPRGGQILGKEALPNLADLDHAPDLAVLGVGGANLERAILEVIDKGAISAVIFDSCHGNTASGKPLLAHLKSIAAEAGLPVCGGSGMGVINSHIGAAASFYGAGHLKPGGLSLTAHSDSVFNVLGMNDPRFRFDLMVSPGQGIGATIDEYITYAAGRETTKAIAVFMEAARTPTVLFRPRSWRGRGGCRWWSARSAAPRKASGWRGLTPGRLSGRTRPMLQSSRNAGRLRSRRSTS